MYLFFATFYFKYNMDIYGIKKNILVIEQVFLDMTMVLVRPMHTRIFQTTLHNLPNPS